MVILKDKLNILTDEKNELKIEEKINRRLYEKNYITYEMYIYANNKILEELSLVSKSS